VARPKKIPVLYSVAPHYNTLWYVYTRDTVTGHVTPLGL